MILTDAGPLVALLDEDDSHHDSCWAASLHLPSEPLLTTWPCFTEAMFFLGKVGGYDYQSKLWRLRQVGRLLLHDLSPQETDRMAVLMDKYKDQPMD